MSDQETRESSESIRIDKWLWAARFFKIRSLAADAVGGGKVAVNGFRAKPSRSVRVGDEINIRRGPCEWTVVVKAVAHLRGPATAAQLLYQEIEASVRKRAAVIAQLKFERPPEFSFPGRPTKKNRRAIARLTNREG